MRKNIVLIGLAFILFYALVWLVWDANKKSEAKAIIRNHEFQVEIADTIQKRELGLGERDSLCESCAMLFVFPEKRKHSFWMKGMRFPLDILWFEGASGKIVHIEKNIPPDSEEVFAPSEEADRVLEINGGLIERFGIQVGDEIRFLQ